jgi:hypothetical protein
MHLILKFSFDGRLFFCFYKHHYGIFLNPQFLFYICDKFYVNISKVYYESTFFLKLIHSFNMIPTKMKITTWIFFNDFILTMNMDLHFKLIIYI